MNRYLSLFVCLPLLLASCSSSRHSTYKNNRTGNDNNINAGVREKYSRLLQVPRSDISNIKLYTFINEWLNTPYKWGGNDKHGIDCSGFINILFDKVYDLKIIRSSVVQLYTKRAELFKPVKNLSEGDLLFFRITDSKDVSHVGIYLMNNMFVNSSVSKGVSIASLNDTYWKKRFVAARRPKALMAGE